MSARFSLLAYTALIIYLSLMPIGKEMPVQIWDKAAHALVYMGFTFIAAFCTQNLRYFMLYLIGFIVFGVGIEIAQGLTAYRSFSYLDMVANSSGIGIGIVLLFTVNKLISLPAFNTQA
ncbi:MAG: VanZ family protein [Pseudomonadales bacterium]|nr:VanZ family protein [Pseudomonadales bacterium]